MKKNLFYHIVSEMLQFLIIIAAFIILMSIAGGGSPLVILLIIIAVVLYFLPAIIAKVRNHSNVMAVFILNLFLGWTFLGWIAALVWAFTTDTKEAIRDALYEYKELERLEKRKKELEMDLKSQKRKG